MRPPTIIVYLVMLTPPIPILSLDNLNLMPNSVLPYRPISTNRIGTISFTTNSAKVVKTFNLEAHTEHFHNIVGLWSSIFLEEQLRTNTSTTTYTKNIDQQNPECRDLRAIIMEELKSVSDLLYANVHPADDDPHAIHKRSPRTANPSSRELLITNRHEPPSSYPNPYIKSRETPQNITVPSINKRSLYSATSTITLNKRAVFVKSALTLFKAYLAKKGASKLTAKLLPTLKSQSAEGILPIGGDILSYIFGLASSKDTQINNKLINALSNRVNKLGINQVELIQTANLTNILMNELADIVSENDKRITNLFNEVNSHKIKQQRSIVCLTLFAQSSNIIDIVKSHINEFILSDTLLPQGNKKLFSERELYYLMTTYRIRNFRLATGQQNLWDYPIFSMNKTGMEWSYGVHIPLTNLPEFTNYKLSPFPVFPKPNPGLAIQVEIYPDTNVILATDENTFIDKIDKETCSFSGTHGICSGPLGLIDIDFAPCSVCLLLHSPEKLLQKCTFIPYTGTFPRIASSMGQFLLTSQKSHDFIKYCPKIGSSGISTDPGSTKLSLGYGCSLNASDINLMLPREHITLHNHKINNNPASTLRFSDELPLDKAHLQKFPPHTIHLKEQINKINHNQDKSLFNLHFRNNSIFYAFISSIFLILILIVLGLTHFQLRKLHPKVQAMTKLVQPYVERALNRRINKLPTEV